MKFAVERNALKDALAIVCARVKGANVNIPILSHILCEVRDNEIVLTGHDLDSYSQVSLAAEVDSKGAAALPADRVSRLVSGMGDGSTVSLDCDGKTARIVGGGSTFAFHVLPKADFPGTFEMGQGADIDLTPKQINRLFKVPLPFTLEMEGRAYLGGIYLHRKNGRLAACASDAHTMYRVFVDVESSDFDGVLVPPRACSEFTRIVGGSESARITVTETLISIACGSRKFVSRLIDAKFPPDYERIIIDPNAPFMTVETKQMRAAMARLQAVTDPKASAYVKLYWDDEAQFLRGTLRSNYGEGDERVECDCPGREAGAIGAQLPYIDRVLDALDGENTRFIIHGPGDAIRVENPNDPDAVAIVLPVNLR